MIHKRPFAEDDASCEVACKHQRHSDHDDQAASYLPLDNVHHIHQNSGVDCFSECQDVGRSATDSVTDFFHGVNKEFENSATGCFPHFFWVSNAFLEADNLSFFPEYFDGYQPRPLLQPDEILSSLDSPIRKQVSIGPEHQVDVPELNISSNQLDKSDDDYEEKLMGACVITMPQWEESANYRREGNDVDCGCLDTGSIRCVRQHVIESRQKLRENLGDGVFEGLGFCDMGEEVAKKWTGEEEEAFHEVVLSNPASVGRNFWDHLSAAFPSRTKKELVSYYFNVFILRKRAEQNRFDPLNVDSDNDEWERSEAGMAEEDEDSVVESLTAEAPSAYYQEEDHGDDYNEEIEDEVAAARDGADNTICRIPTDDQYEGDVDDMSEELVGIPSVDCNDATGLKLLSRIPSKNGDDNDTQDDSCTSDEFQRDNVDCCGPLDGADGRHCSQE